MSGVPVVSEKIPDSVPVPLSSSNQTPSKAPLPSQQEPCLNPPFKPAIYPLADPYYFNIHRPIIQSQLPGLPASFLHAPLSTLAQFDTDIPSYKYLNEEELIAFRDLWNTTYTRSYVDHSPYDKYLAFQKLYMNRPDPKPDCYLEEKPVSIFPKVPIQKQDNEFSIAVRELAHHYKSPEEIRAAQINWGQFLNKNPARYKPGTFTILPRQRDYHYDGARIVYRPEERINNRMYLRTFPSADMCYRLQPINQETLEMFRKTSPFKKGFPLQQSEEKKCDMKIKILD